MGNRQIGNVWMIDHVLLVRWRKNPIETPPTNFQGDPIHGGTGQTCCECQSGTVTYRSEGDAFGNNFTWGDPIENCENNAIAPSGSEPETPPTRLFESVEKCCVCECGETTFTFHAPTVPTSFGTCSWEWSAQFRRWLKTSDDCTNHGTCVAPSGTGPGTRTTYCDSPYGHCIYKWVTNPSEGWVLLYNGCKDGPTGQGTPTEPPENNPQGFRTYKTPCTPPKCWWRIVAI